MRTKRSLSAEHHPDGININNDDLKLLACQNGVAWAQLGLDAGAGRRKPWAAIQAPFAVIFEILDPSLHLTCTFSQFPCLPASYLSEARK